MTTHATIDRLHSICRGLGNEELTAHDLGEALKLQRRSVGHLLAGHAIEHTKLAAHHRGKLCDTRKTRGLYTIQAAAVLTYLVRQTGGDKAVILEAIRLRFPHHLALCERIAAGMPALVGTTCASSDSPLPDNVVHISDAPKPRRTRKAATPEREHPDQMHFLQFSA